MGKQTTSVRTALWLHARAFYSTVRSQPQSGMYVPTALLRNKAMRGPPVPLDYMWDHPRVLRFSRAHRNPCTPLNVALEYETLNLKQMQYTFKTSETFET